MFDEVFEASCVQKLYNIMSLEFFSITIIIRKLAQSNDATCVLHYVHACVCVYLSKLLRLLGI